MYIYILVGKSWSLDVARPTCWKTSYLLRHQQNSMGLTHKSSRSHSEAKSRQTIGYQTLTSLVPRCSQDFFWRKCTKKNTCWMVNPTNGALYCSILGTDTSSNWKHEQKKQIHTSDRTIDFLYCNWSGIQSPIKLKLLWSKNPGKLTCNTRMEVLVQRIFRFNWLSDF